MHGQNITCRPERNGLPCAACYRDRHGTHPHEPPGAPSWLLLPPGTPAVFQGRTPRQLCEQLEDPRQTGGKDLAALVHHAGHDAVVGWGLGSGSGAHAGRVLRIQLAAAMEA